MSQTPSLRVSGPTQPRLAVVVPVFNEAAGILPTLEALRTQADTDFDAVFVDNASTDGSARIIEDFATRHGLPRWRVIREETKGTGAAADTGMRAAIASGAALLARTDADCLPRRDWTASIRRALTDPEEGGLGLEFVGGELVARRDEGVGAPTRFLLRWAVHLAEAFGRFRPGNRDPRAVGPYMMAAGCNVAITSSLYLEAGGFPRTKIEEVHEDRALVNAVRRLTPRYARRSDVVVFGSSRRVVAWGLAKTLLWYKDHAYLPAHVDIRDPHRAVEERREERKRRSADTRRRASTAAADDAAQAVATDRSLLRSAHPVAFPLLNAVPAPVKRIPGVGVVVKDAALQRQILMDTEHFSKNGPGAPGDLWTPVLGPRVLLNMEGEDHARLRRQLAPLFSPRFVQDLVQDSLGPATAALGERLARGERVDVVAHAKANASAVIASLVGLPPGVVTEDFFARSAAITGYVTLARPSLTARQVRHAKVVLAELDEHASRAFDGDESTVPGRMRALGLSREEALGAVGAFVLTGTETLVSFVPRLAALLCDSGWQRRLAAMESGAGRDRLLESVIAEALRITTPTPIMLRAVERDTRIGDVEVRAGDRVILGTWWADQGVGGFDPGENPAATLKQLWFGAGAHFCLGAPLAMAQIRQVLRPLVDTPALTVVGRAPAKGVLIPAYARLDLVSAPGGDAGGRAAADTRGGLRD